MLGLAIGFGSYNYVFYLLLTWLPSYLSMALHIDLLHSFLYTSVPWLFATVTDLLIGGWLVDALIRRGWNASLVRQVVLVGGTTCGLGILGAAHAHTASQALLWISVSIGGLAAAAPVAWSIPSLIASPHNAGKVGGIVNLSSQISGIAAPILTGYLVAATQSFAWAFGACAVYLVIGIAAYRLDDGQNRAGRHPAPRSLIRASLTARGESHVLKGHDRGTLWVACRKCRKINVGFSPWEMFFGIFDFHHRRLAATGDRREAAWPAWQCHKRR